MWRMHDGNRVLTESEWAVFRTGLDLLRDFVESDISAEEDTVETGVPAFDRLTAEQKLALLAEVASAVREPTIPMPVHTAANEGAIMAVLETFREMLREEVESGDDRQTHLRTSLLAAVAGEEVRPPKPTSKRWEAWSSLCECVTERMLWDCDFDLGDEFLDLPPEEARAQLSLAGIDADYFLSVPDEPNEERLIAARQTLARLIGLAVPDDDGLYPALVDLFHDLTVGPVSAEAALDWEGKPWVEVVASTGSGWDCDYPTWVSRFGGALPQSEFEVTATPDVHDALPEGFSTEFGGGSWTVRDDRGAYWCGLIENGWTDTPDRDTPALTFGTEEGAVAAFLDADRMYGERTARRTAALARLELSD